MLHNLLPPAAMLLLVAAAAVATTGGDNQQVLMVECPELRPATVCPLAQAGFAYSDGCNRVRCLDNGLWVSTRRSCPRADKPEERRQCQEAERLVNERLGAGRGDAEDGSEAESGKQQQQQEFACPALAASLICKASTNGFSYSDGCNFITCHYDGTGQSTFKYCPKPEESDSAGLEYCQSAEREMRAKMERASLRSRCLLPEDVCQGPNLRRIAYNDGCNRCFCAAPGEAACTRRGCPRVLMTDEEFKAYCKQRGAGRH